MGAVIIAGRYVPNPPDDTPLNIKSGKVPAVLPTVGGNYPFEAHFWRFDGDESAVWYGRARNEPLTLTLGPAVTPLVPTRWKFDYDPPREWTGAPGSAFFLLSNTLQLYAPALSRIFPNPDDAGNWGTKSGQVNNLLLNPPAIVNPFIPSRWKFDYNDASVSPGSIPRSIIYQLVIATPVVPARWKFDNDDPSVWSGAPSDVSVNITQPLPPVVPPADNGVRGSETILTNRSAGHPLSRKRWRELLEESEAQEARAKSPKAKAAIRKAVEAVDEAVGLRAVDEDAGKRLADLVAAAQRANAVNAVKQAHAIREQARLLLERSLDDDEDEIMILAMAL